MNRPIYQRFVVVSAGVFANIVCAFVFVVLTAAIWGQMPSGKYDVFVKELALEEVRESKFPDLPSRLHCMYLSIGKDIALQNIDSMSKNKEKNGKQFQAIAVKLNGKIFKAGKFYMTRESESYEYYKEKAYGYWSQKDLKDEEVKEILFEGVAEVVEILKEINKNDK